MCVCEVCKNSSSYKRAQNFRSFAPPRKLGRLWSRAGSAVEALMCAEARKWVLAHKRGKKPLYIYFVKSSSCKELRTSAASLPPSFIVREDSPDCLAGEALSCSRRGKKRGKISTQKKFFFLFCFVLIKTCSGSSFFYLYFPLSKKRR